jgi:hypothetical protein
MSLSKNKCLLCSKKKLKLHKSGYNFNCLFKYNIAEPQTTTVLNQKVSNIYNTVKTKRYLGVNHSCAKTGTVMMHLGLSKFKNETLNIY